MDYTFENIIFSIIITLITIFFIPMLFIGITEIFIPEDKLKKIKKKHIVIFVILNSILSLCIFMVVCFFSNTTPSVAPIIFWSAIVYKILIKHLKINNNTAEMMLPEDKDTAINNAQQNVNLQEKEKQTELNNSNKKNNNSIIAEKSTPVSENDSDEDDRIWICYQQPAQTNDEKSSTKEKAVHHKISAKTIVLTIISICLVISIVYNFYQVSLINESKEQLNISSETIASLEEEKDKYKTNAEYLDMIYHFSGSAGSVKDVYITSLSKEKGIHLDDKNYIVAKQSNQNVEIVESWLPSEFKIKPLKNGYTYVTFRNTETYKTIDMLIIVTDLSYSNQYTNTETALSNNKSYNDGYSDGYDRGYEVGYEVGYEAGLDNDTDENTKNKLDRILGNVLREKAENATETATKQTPPASSPNVITPIE